MYGPPTQMNGNGKEPQKETDCGKTSRSNALQEQHLKVNVNTIQKPWHPRRKAVKVQAT